METVDCMVLFSRFLLVGIINTIVGLSMMLTLFHIGFTYWLATFIGNVIGACVSFSLNRSFTFKSKQTDMLTVVRFFTVIGVCYSVSYFIGIQLATNMFRLFMSFPSQHIEDAAILFGTALYTVLNFFGQKQFVFVQRPVS
jgi:putative flippase GtrA